MNLSYFLDIHVEKRRVPRGGLEPRHADFQTLPRFGLLSPKLTPKRCRTAREQQLTH